jgi:flavin reductase (DIM6/NTAB) family NADH-FMN oxidoreductase RutF
MYPRHTVLVTCGGKDRKNIITIGWSMPVSINPPMIAISVHPRRYSYELIRDSKEFVVNVPTAELKDATLHIGKTSGRGHDKFSELGLTPISGKTVSTPAIKECVASLECKLVNEIKTGDHFIFIGEVTAAYYTEGMYDRKYALGLQPLIYHLGGNDFSQASQIVMLPSKKSGFESLEKKLRGISNST